MKSIKSNGKPAYSPRAPSSNHHTPRARPSLAKYNPDPPGSPSCYCYSSSLNRYAPDTGTGHRWPNWLLDKKGSVNLRSWMPAQNDRVLTNGFNMIPNKTVIFAEALQRHAAMLTRWDGLREQSTPQPSPIVMENLSTSSTIKAGSMRPCSRLHVSNSVKQEKLILRLVPSRKTQWWAIVCQICYQWKQKWGY